MAFMIRCTAFPAKDSTRPSSAQLAIVSMVSSRLCSVVSMLSLLFLNQFYRSGGFELRDLDAVLVGASSWPGSKRRLMMRSTAEGCLRPLNDAAWPHGIASSVRRWPLREGSRRTDSTVRDVLEPGRRARAMTKPPRRSQCSVMPNSRLTFVRSVSESRIGSVRTVPMTLPLNTAQHSWLWNRDR